MSATFSANSTACDFLTQHHIWTPKQLSQRVAEMKRTEYLIEGLIPQQAINISVGDSGLGKSPLNYLEGLCVAAGVPFLNRPVKQGRVLYLDYENSSLQSSKLISTLSSFLNLSEPPDNFRLWNKNDSLGPLDLHRACEEFKPAWIIVDALTGMYPTIERDNPTAASALQELRTLMAAHGCAVTLLHHLRKPNDNPRFTREPLEPAEWNTWFYQARGPGVLINGSDVRLGIDRPLLSTNEDLLIIKGFERVNGPIPIIRITRVRDESGDPIGYKLLAGADQLTNLAHRAAYEQLPDEFNFTTAKQVYGKSDQPTIDFLNKCRSAGILQKLRKGWSYGQKTRRIPHAQHGVRR